MPIQRIQSLSLRQKMLALNVFGGAVTMLATLGLFSLIYFYSAQQRLTDHAIATARLLAQNLTPMVVFGDRQSARRLLTSLDQHPDALMATVYDEKGQIFAAWTQPKAPSQKMVIPAAPAGPEAGFTRLEAGQLEIVVPLLQERERIGAFLLRESLCSIGREIQHFMAIGLVLTLSTIALAALLLHRLQLRALAPVFELSDLAERVASQFDYGLRARARGNDEMGRLARCFNVMLERIEAREKALNAEIGERRAVEQKLDRLAHYDSLTQLPNRHLFQKELQRVVAETVAEKQLAALLFIDLDNFKYANDAAGHDAGDLLLKVVAKRLSAVLRNSDTLCRLGGDEFAAILPQLGGASQAEALAERLIAAVNGPILIRGVDMRVGASIGIAWCPTHAADPGLLLRQADRAMYVAKQAGKNTYRHFDRAMLFDNETLLALPAFTDTENAAAE
ncbi:MAG TPA: diguanylate cyclase [Candidatus Competibacter sp.]|nr:GGDEF domain-containing protein [Candidatus Competibacteraceae bacterium]HRC71460.1 diguanylate cyclase [Candidatus Competibacter sp.]